VYVDVAVRQEEGDKREETRGRRQEGGGNEVCEITWKRIHSNIT
jgi:hypothetical protein